jgi:hypothetical protein
VSGEREHRKLCHSPSGCLPIASFATSETPPGSGVPIAIGTLSGKTFLVWTEPSDTFYKIMCSIRDRDMCCIRHREKIPLMEQELYSDEGV